MRKKIKPSSCRQSERQEDGFLLIELLVAIVMSAFVAAALFDGYSTSLRGSVTAQQQITAATIVQEALDEARNQSWPNLQTLAAAGTPQNLQVVASQSTMVSGRPLAINTDLSYASQYQASKGCAFNGTVSRSFTSVNATTVQVTVSATWTPPGASSAKTLTQSALITQNGIHTN